MFSLVAYLGLNTCLSFYNTLRLEFGYHVFWLLFRFQVIQFYYLTSIVCLLRYFQIFLYLID